MAAKRVHILHEQVTDLRPGGRATEMVYGYFRSFSAAHRYADRLAEDRQDEGYVRSGAVGWNLTHVANARNVVYRLESAEYLGEYGESK